MKYNYHNDGIDHINIYSKGKTSLGQFLSNFAECDLQTEDGYFRSIEGYWYWLRCPETEEREQLRDVHGFAAKNLGRKLQSPDWPKEKDEGFKNKIKAAIKYKIQNNAWAKKNFTKSTLPLTHYYVFYEKTKEPESGKWILDFMEELRTEMKIEINNEQQ